MAKADLAVKLLLLTGSNLALMYAGRAGQPIGLRPLGQFTRNYLTRLRPYGDRVRTCRPVVQILDIGCNSK